MWWKASYLRTETLMQCVPQQKAMFPTLWSPLRPGSWQASPHFQCSLVAYGRSAQDNKGGEEKGNFILGKGSVRKAKTAWLQNEASSQENKGSQAGKWTISHLLCKNERTWVQIPRTHMTKSQVQHSCEELEVRPENTPSSWVRQPVTHSLSVTHSRQIPQWPCLKQCKAVFWPPRTCCGT